MAGQVPSTRDAWQQIWQAMRKYGWVQEPAWPHPAMGKAIDRMYGGWADLCEAVREADEEREGRKFALLYAEVLQNEYGRKPPRERPAPKNQQVLELPETPNSPAGE